jgi:hypothetical protein
MNQVTEIHAERDHGVIHEEDVATVEMSREFAIGFAAVDVPIDRLVAEEAGGGDTRGG